MNNFKKNPSTPTTQNSLYINPLSELNNHSHRHIRSSSESLVLANPRGCAYLSRSSTECNNNKENATPNSNKKDDESEKGGESLPAKSANMKSLSTGRVLRPTSLEFCMQINENEFGFGGSSVWEADGSDHSSSLKIWDYSDSEAAPASSWSTLPNRSLLCRPLPVDVGRCTCVIVKEASPEGFRGGTVYSLYTYEGQGRQNRKLAVAQHRKHKGRTEFSVAQSLKGIMSSSDDGLVGTITANLMGSKYHVWDQRGRLKHLSKQTTVLLAAIKFVPTITTWTGSYRSLRAYVPKHQSMMLKNTTQMQHISGLPVDWEERRDRVHQLYSRAPRYNNISKQYELDYRDRGRAGLRIQSSVKNFQLTLEDNGKQTILQLGRVGKAKYVMDYRYPLTGYQAFCICLASIDSKMCCAI